MLPICSLHRCLLTRWVLFQHILFVPFLVSAISCVNILPNDLLFTVLGEVNKDIWRNYLNNVVGSFICIWMNKWCHLQFGTSTFPAAQGNLPNVHLWTYKLEKGIDHLPCSTPLSPNSRFSHKVDTCSPHQLWKEPGSVFLLQSSPFTYLNKKQA